MSDHGHDDHGSKGGSTAPSGPKHSVTTGAAGTMIGMFGFLFTGLFDNGGGGHGGHH